MGDPILDLRTNLHPAPPVAALVRPATWIRTPADLLSHASAHALRVDLHHRPLFRTWTRFRRERRGESAIAIPRAETIAPGIARVRLVATDPDATHIELRIPSLPGERFVGFGERFNAVDQRGQRLEVWAEEGAIGLGERLSRVLTRLGARFNPFPKGPTTAYKPFPWFVSSRGYAILLDTSSLAFFDVAASDPSVVACEVAAREVDVLVFFDGDPKSLVQRFVAHTGLPCGVPDWALGPWNDALHGEDEARRVAALLRAERIPSSAIWLEDWQNGHWSFPGDTRLGWFNINPVLRDVDRSRYPGFETLARELHDGGFKVLGYAYPYVALDDPAYADAAARGYFLRDEAGSVATVQIFTSRCAQIDLTNPAAAQWHKEELRRAVTLGFDGWMADFGEYTPIDSVAHDGTKGLAHHNAYPRLWAKQNAEALKSARPDGDFVFFSRAAGPGQQPYSPVFWSGDSNTDFERWDGLPSNLPALLSAALSGIAIWAADVGGYMSMFTPGRDEETLARWSELAALLPIFRTHHGTHPRRSVQFDANARTLAHYGACARLHTALFPLFRGLVDEAMRDGTPVCRPLLMEYPWDEAAWKIEDQFLVGTDLLVAPVVTRGAVVRSVYLPAGSRWIDLATGELHDGGRRVEADAPLGTIPLFLRDGGWLPLFDRPVDTLVRRRQVRDPGVMTLDDAEASLAVILTPSFIGPVTAYDGTVIARSSREPARHLARTTPGDLNVLPTWLTSSWKRLGSGEGAEGAIACGGDVWLDVRSPRARRVTVYGAGPWPVATGAGETRAH